VQGIADQFHQYQCETVQRRQRTTRRAHGEPTARCCDGCCTYYFIPCCCVCGWLCCSNLSGSNMHGDADEEAGGGGGMEAPPHYQKIDPFHRVLALDGGITPTVTARAAGSHPWCGVVPALCYSVLLLIVLLSMSSTTKFIDESHRTWSLRPGETRQVPVPVLFNKDIRISTTTRQGSSDGDGFADRGRGGVVNVYSFDGDCPPLTGPPVVLEKGSRTLELAKGDYQYDYFFLNQGSQLHVHVQQLQGSSNIHLMIGDQVLERLVHENRDNAYVGGFKDSLVRKFATAAATPTTTTKGAEENNSNQVSLDYTAHETDTYIVIYENAATGRGGRGVLSVDYRVSLSSYDLQPYSPVCRVVHSNTEADDNDDDDSTTTAAAATAVNACVLTKASAVHGQGCLLVQAASTTTTDYQSSSNSTSLAVSTIIHVNETRRWVPLLLCSAVPFLLVIAIRACSNGYRRKMEVWYDKVDTNDECTEHPSPPEEAVPSITLRKEEDHPLFATVPTESDGLLQFSAAAAAASSARGGDVDGIRSSSVYYDAIPIAVLPASANNEVVGVPVPPRYPVQGSSSNGITAKAER